MCGVVGAIILSGSSPGLVTELRVKVEKALQAINHRGPDHSGVFCNDNSILGHVRLSILDTSKNGNQPLSNHNSDVLVYNGEVYNYKSIKKKLTNNVYYSTSDSEVVLNAISEKGVEALKSFNGMFSLCHLSKKDEKYIIARDKYGIKPLFYFYSNDVLYFSSEIKAIRLMIKGNLELNTNALSEWSYYGNTLGESTMYLGVKKLLPGHYIEVFNNNFTINRYYNSVNNDSMLRINKQQNSYQDCKTELSSILKRSVCRQLVSDVPLGVFLSGGIDSSAIATIASEHLGSKLKTFTAKFDYSKSSQDLKLAEKLSKQLNTEHHVIEVSTTELISTIEELVDFHDAPFSDAANIPLYLMAKTVKNDVKVILQGDGGDELFAGYRRYKTLHQIEKIRSFLPILNPLSNLMNRFNSKEMKRYSRYFHALSQKDNCKLFALLLTQDSPLDSPEQIFLNKIPSNAFSYYNKISLEVEQNAKASLVEKMLDVDFKIILPDLFFEKVDRSTMAQSIEVRVPFMDDELVNYSKSLPISYLMRNGKPKGMLRECLSSMLPDYIVKAPKMGFSVPYGTWLQHPLKEYFYFNLEQIKPEKVLDVRYLEQVYKNFIAGNNNSEFLLWKALNFMVWYRKNFI